LTDTAKKTDAWMPLWVGDYLADTQHLTMAEHGAYFLLMMAYWRNRGPLVDDDKRLAAIVKVTPKEWKALRSTMAEFFQVDAGRWSHKRIEAELSGADVRSEKAAAKAKAAAQARWGNSSKDAKSNAPSMPQAVPKDMHEVCPSPSPSPIGIHTGLENTKTSVCADPHTQFSEKFRAAATSRPELDIDAVWAKFNDHYPPDKRTVARWKTWLTNEHAPRVSSAGAPSTSDPDSRSSIEAMGVAKGIGKWSELEQWSVYRDRVMATFGAPA